MRYAVKEDEESYHSDFEHEVVDQVLDQTIIKTKYKHIGEDLCVLLNAQNEHIKKLEDALKPFLCQPDTLLGLTPFMDIAILNYDAEGDLIIANAGDLIYASKMWKG